ncbi:MAG: SH3 domain-containing protein [Campylobacterota bacterium]|nr:SH3 domain-containing protein [Campylobacterota bacterium]
MISKLLKTTIFIALLTTHLQATADGPNYYRVVGVASNDVLWMRDKPHHRSPKIAQIPHNARKITPIKCQWITPKSRWCKVAYHGQIGWVNARYLGEDL